MVSIFVIRVRSLPYKSTRQNIVTILSDLLYCLIILTEVLLLFIRDKLTQDEIEFFIGNPMILMMVLLVTINVINGLIDLLIEVVSIIKKFWKKLRERNKIENDKKTQNDKKQVDKESSLVIELENKTKVKKAKKHAIYPMRSQNVDIQRKPKISPFRNKKYKVPDRFKKKEKYVYPGMVALL